ncbi:MAG: type II toxin-antitoxin system RelE/ParE family toxin [Streptococcaceae bacterium]|jgi:plasmid stabilization system protein ParE|nr:type II toxin-antitoxin system RelE/ParE family toxin [Streptococcaceae bacterium]
MSFVLENSPRVYDDIVGAVEYFLSINPKLAEDFLGRIEDAKQTILNTPSGFQVKYSGIRTVLLKQFPYHIYYILDGYRIIILAILHAHSGKKKISEINPVK